MAAQPGDSILLRPIDTTEAEPRSVLVAGATGGIGSALCQRLTQQFTSTRIIRMARDPTLLRPAGDATTDLRLDLSAEKSIENAVAQIPRNLSVDWAFVATGWLHDSQYSPEKTYKSLDADHLLRAYRINAVGPALLIKHLLSKLDSMHACRVGIISARVGSVSDNRLGGWHAYRASKAALNMLIKNFAIELARKKTPHVIVGLQPGTTDTALSAPFQRNVPQGQLQTPDYTATQLIKVMQKLRREDSGELFDFLGLPFAP